MVEGLLVGIQLIKKHKPKDTRSVMRFANRVLFSTEISSLKTVIFSIDGHEHLKMSESN